MNELKLEENKLKEILIKYDDIIKHTEKNYKEIPYKYSKNVDQMYLMSEMFGKKLILLNKNKEKPYFARIDFEDENNNLSKCYIGKVGMFDEDHKIVTVDWRAPISSLYYDSNVGEVSYVAPEGTINGKLHVKRQFDIENSKLISYQDVDTVSNDEILKPYLNASADNRLKNIVSTIQNEQNSIIRESLYNNMIIQGVAGSGKTTVALHRIAYLVYNYIDLFKPQNYLVLGPNKFFINYISSVLPDLDVNNVHQLTYEEFTSKYLNEKLDIINDESITKLKKLKTSIKYKEIIDNFINDYKNNFIPENDLVVKNYLIYKRKEILDIFNEFSYIENLSVRVDKTIMKLEKNISLKYSLYLSKIQNEYYKKVDNVSKEELKLLKKEYDDVIKEFKNNFKSSLKKYFVKINTKTTTIYKLFLSEINKYISIDETINNKLTLEDLPALLYLHYILKKDNPFNDIRHSVIDEAQDYGTFNFYALKLIMNKTTFSIYGDLAQSIYDYKSIDSWEEVSSKIFDNEIETKYLLKSYRTTVEIMNSANKILKFIKLKESLPVIRHGEEVILEKGTDKSISKYINKYLDKNYKSIAIITKDNDEKEELYKNLKTMNYDLVKINSKDVIYESGLCILTSSEAKGLEFDAVIVTNADESKYNSENKLDMKLLYVAMTRALHELVVLYKGNITFPLRGNDENNYN